MTEDIVCPECGQDVPVFESKPYPTGEVERFAMCPIDGEVSVLEP